MQPAKQAVDKIIDRQMQEETTALTDEEKKSVHKFLTYLVLGELRGEKWVYFILFLV